MPFLINILCDPSDMLLFNQQAFYSTTMTQLTDLKGSITCSKHQLNKYIDKQMKQCQRINQEEYIISVVRTFIKLKLYTSTFLTSQWWLLGAEIKKKKIEKTKQLCNGINQLKK